MLKILLFFVLVGLVFPLPAQQAFVDCADDPINCTLDNLLDVPVNIFNFLLTMAGVVFLAVIIFAGMRMIMHHVSETPEQELTNAKLTLQRGIAGFVIIAFSYVFVNFLLYVLGFESGSAVADIINRFK